MDNIDVATVLIRFVFAAILVLVNKPLAGYLHAYNIEHYNLRTPLWVYRASILIVAAGTVIVMLFE